MCKEYWAAKTPKLFYLITFRKIFVPMNKNSLNSACLYLAKSTKRHLIRQINQWGPFTEEFYTSVFCCTIWWNFNQVNKPSSR